jgi:hypothetical protein
MKLNNDTNFIKMVLICLVLVIINMGAYKIIFQAAGYDVKGALGGNLAYDDYEKFTEYADGNIKPDDNYIERFLRPSNDKELDKKYNYDKRLETTLPTFASSSDVVRAYFDLLSDASNMNNKSGGCGSIGFDKLPYPIVYNLLSHSFKKELTYEKFLDSFASIGHINLIKLIEAPAVKIDGEVCPRYFVEIETIEGSEVKGKTYFAYYYGYITTLLENKKDWRLGSISLKPEDFLCHAYHGWWNDAGTIVDALYIKKTGVMIKVLGIEEDGYERNVLAKGRDGREYRFLFIRLTNGADIELRQYVMEEGKWKDTTLNTGRE